MTRIWLNYSAMDFQATLQRSCGLPAAIAACPSRTIEIPFCFHLGAALLNLADFSALSRRHPPSSFLR